jgi:molybdate transport system substrate-binding protein
MKTARCWIVLAALAGSVGLGAAELVVLSAGAMEPAVIPLLLQFQRASGHTMRVEYGTAPELSGKLARNQASDVLIAPKAVMDQADTDSRVVASSRRALGRIGVGVFVKRGAAPPDVSTEAALRQALLKAEALVYTQGSSGQYVEELVRRLGIEREVAARTIRTPDADTALARVAAGTDGMLGLGAVTVIRAHETRGTQLVAPLPDHLQNFTEYFAAMRTGAVTPDVAKAFLDYLGTPAAGTTLRNAGVQ